MTMFVGISSLELRFPVGIPLAGFAARDSYATGSHDPLYVRAICVGDDRQATLIVCADLTSLSPQQTRHVRHAIAERTGLPAEAIAVSVTHTHAAPNLDPNMTTDVSPDAVIEASLNALADAGVQAWQDRVPATLGHTRGRSHLPKNRRRPDGPVDDSLDVIRVDSHDGDPLAVVFSLACHPTVIGPANASFSADWPGFARVAVEAALPGATAIFLQGCCGDCNAGHSAHASMDLQLAVDGRTPEAARRFGELIGSEVARLAPLIVTDDQPVSAAAREFTWTWPAKDSAVLTEQAAAAGAVTHPLHDLVGIWRERNDTGPDRVEEPLSVQLFVWGSVPLALLSGENFAQLALDIKSTVGDELIVIGYANGVPGYAPYPQHELDRGGYEATEAHFVYGRRGPLPVRWSEFALATIDELYAARP